MNPREQARIIARSFSDSLLDDEIKSLAKKIEQAIHAALDGDKQDRQIEEDIAALQEKREQLWWELNNCAIDARSEMTRDQLHVLRAPIWQDMKIAEAELRSLKIELKRRRRRRSGLGIDQNGT